MEQEVCLLCEDSLEGILTGVYEALRRGAPLGASAEVRRGTPQRASAEVRRGAPQGMSADTARLRLQIGTEETYRLFTEYVEVSPDAEKTARVMRTLRRILGGETLRAVCMAAAASDAKKADAICQMILRGLASARPRRILDDLTDEAVRTVFALSRSVSGECSRMIEFLRFEELRQGLLFARIEPRHDVLAYVGAHFADRLPLERFLIYDRNRENLLLHPAGGAWYIRRGVRRQELRRALAMPEGETAEDLGLVSAMPEGAAAEGLGLVSAAPEREAAEGLGLVSAMPEGEAAEGLGLASAMPEGEAAEEPGDALPRTEGERFYRELFRCFCHSVSIPERRNPKLQRQNMPLRYQTYMPEMQEK